MALADQLVNIDLDILQFEFYHVYYNLNGVRPVFLPFVQHY